MSTIYTLNGKVLKNSANDKWLIKAVPPPAPEEVTIGTQTWKTMNLAIDDGQGGIYTQTVNYGQGDVTEYYYTWDAAVRVAATVHGWRLPLMSDFAAFYYAFGNTAGTKLKSTYGWSSGNGTDDYGFCALPSGYCYTSASLLNFGTECRIWTSEKNGNEKAYYNIFNTGAGTTTGSEYMFRALSVRLIKDE